MQPAQPLWAFPGAMVISPLPCIFWRHILRYLIAWVSVCASHVFGYVYYFYQYYELVPFSCGSLGWHIWSNFLFCAYFFMLIRLQGFWHCQPAHFPLLQGPAYCSLSNVRDRVLLLQVLFVFTMSIHPKPVSGLACICTDNTITITVHFRQVLPSIGRPECLPAIFS